MSRKESAKCRPAVSVRAPGGCRKLSESGGVKAGSLDALDARRRAYVLGRVEGKTKMQAALDAGFPRSMAQSARARVETPSVRHAFQELVGKAIPEEKIIERLAEGLDAERQVVVVTGRKGEESVRVTSVADFRERREYLTLAAKLGGYYVEKQIVEQARGELENLSDEELLRRSQELARTLKGGGGTVQ